MKKHTLMVPGPVEVSTDVMNVMASPQTTHYSAEAITLYNSCVEKLKPMFGLSAGGNVYIFPGSGSVAMEMCSATFINRGDKVLVASNGTFGKRLRDQAELYGADIVDVTAPEGEVINPEVIDEVLKNNPDITLVMTVHLETSTGALNPIEAIGAVVKRHGKLFAVDAVSSFGTEAVNLERWHAHICGTATQKGLETPPGLGITGITQSGWDELIKRGYKGNGWFLNLLVWKKVQEGKEIRKGVVYPLPVTMPVNNVASLLKSLERIEAEGLSARIKRHGDIAEAVRKGMGNIGFEPFPPPGAWANGVTSLRNNLNIDVADLIEYVKKSVHIEISNGLFDLYNKLIRIGHMGTTAEAEYVIPVLVAIENYVRKKGIKINEGVSLSGLWVS